MPQTEQLDTERLYLRTLAEADCGEIYRLTSAYPNISEYMTWNPPQNYDEVRHKFLENRKTDDRHFGVFTKDGDDFLGRITVRNFHLMQQDAEKNSVFLSFWLSPEHQGKGFGTEILTEVCRYCIVDLKVRKIFAGTFSENKASQGLLLKTGFREIGTLRKHYLKNGIFYDSVRYELLNEDFLAHRTAPKVS